MKKNISFHGIVRIFMVSILFWSCRPQEPEDNLTGQISIAGADTALVLRPRTFGKGLAFRPPSVDLFPFAPPVTQQPYNDCYAFASVYAARTILYNITHNYTNHPDSTIFSVGFLQKAIYLEDQHKCEKWGYDTRAACDSLQTIGCVFQRDYPDICAAGALTPDIKNKAAQYKIIASSLYKPCAANAEKIDAIKASLAAKKPVVLGWYSVRSFNKYGYNKDEWQPATGDLPHNCNLIANHAICVVGYDDGKYGGAFRIMNSWGSEWGKGGLIWIPYDALAQFSSFGIELSTN